MFKKLTLTTLIALGSLGTAQQAQGMNYRTLIEGLGGSGLIIVAGCAVWDITHGTTRIIPQKLLHTINLWWKPYKALRIALKFRRAEDAQQAITRILALKNQPTNRDLTDSNAFYFNPLTRSLFAGIDSDYAYQTIGEQDIITHHFCLLTPTDLHFAQMLLRNSLHPQQFRTDDTIRNTPVGTLITEAQFWAQPNSVNALDVQAHYKTLLSEASLWQCLSCNKYTKDNIAQVQRQQTKNNLFSLVKYGFNCNITFTELD
jgi:hypothetical protein